jgi:D-alanyl-D-alanine carboxypeptidase
MSVAWIRTVSFRFAGALAAAVLAASAGGCTAAPDPPNQPPPAIERLAAALEQFGNSMLDAGSPALLVQAKVRDDEWSRASGTRSLDSQAPVEISDPVQAAGVTKSFVAVSVLKLVAEGRVRLEDQVSQHLPDFEGVVHLPGPVTVRHLLQHRSGMPDYGGALLQRGTLREVLGMRLSLQDRLALAGTLPWERKLAQGIEYSDSDYVALPMIVERLRGRPIGDVLRTDVVEPLGLAGTSLAEPGPAPPAMVHGYITFSGERLDVTHPDVQIGSPASGLISTVGDLNTFYSALLQGRLLPPAMVTEMQSPLYSPHGLGIRRWNDTCTNDFLYGQAGDVPGYGTISMSSADGTRQVSMSVAYPPALFSAGGNGAVDEMIDVVAAALNDAC